MFHDRFRKLSLLSAVVGIAGAQSAAWATTYNYVASTANTSLVNVSGYWGTVDKAWSVAGATAVVWPNVTTADAVIGNASAAANSAGWTLTVGTSTTKASTITAQSVAVSLPAGDKFSLVAGGTGKGASISTANGVSFTAGAGSSLTITETKLSGTGGLTVDIGSGSTLSDTAVSATSRFDYTGVTTLKSGTFQIDNFAIGGSVSGLGASSSIASNLVFDGGTLSSTASSGASTTDRLFTLGTGGGTIDAGAGVLTFSGTGSLAYTGSGAHSLTLTGSRSTATSVFSPIIADATAGASTSLTKSGVSIWQLNAANTYTGNTTVSAGKLILGSTGGLKFVIGATGATNQVTGAGTAEFDGTFTLDLTNASTDPAASWSLVNLPNGVVYGSSFSIAGFTATGDVWSNGTYSFDEATGLLSVVPEPTTLATLSLLTCGAISRRRRVR